VTAAGILQHYSRYATGNGTAITSVNILRPNVNNLPNHLLINKILGDAVQINERRAYQQFAMFQLRRIEPGEYVSQKDTDTGGIPIHFPVSGYQRCPHISPT
jgi:hypothetical protein